MTYKKLFNIKYKDKEFTIFIDEKNRKTFLELTKEGNYIYPTLDDFLYLNQIYNNVDITKVFAIPKLTFKEKVRYQAATLAVIATIGLTAYFKPKQVTVENDNLIITEEEFSPNYLAKSSTDNPNLSADFYYVIKDLNELDTILGYTSISDDEIKEVIDNNPDLTLKYRNAALSILSFMDTNAENPEKRLFYENLKTLKIKEIPITEIQALAGENVAAFYDVKENAIYATPFCSPEIALHEMFHVAHFITITKENAKYYYGYNIENGLMHGIALEEAITNYYIKDIYGLTPTTYTFSGKITDFLLANVPYPYTNYNHYGITNYLATLKEKYPDIDIDYIINYMDALNESTKNPHLDITSTKKALYDELYLITKETLNEKEPYQPLIPFLNMLRSLEGEEDLFKYYYTDFNNYLATHNIPTLDYSIFQTKLTNLSLIDKYLVFENSHVEFIFNCEEITQDNESYYNYSTFDEQGKLITKTVLKSKAMLNYLPNNINVLDTILTYPSENNYATLIANFNRDNMIISPHRYLPIDLIYNDKVIANLNICNNEYDNEVNLYIGLDSNKNITYTIAQKNNIIFTTNNNPLYLSNPLPLSYYLQGYWYESLNLNTILSTDYLTEFLKGSSWFSNVSLEDDHIIVTPLYQISYEDPDYGSTLLDITDIYLSKTSDINGDFYIELNCGYNAPTKIDINPDLINNIVTLKDIMNYFNMLDENVLTYHFTKDEITNLFLSYYHNLSENKAR